MGTGQFMHETIRIMKLPLLYAIAIITGTTARCKDSDIIKISHGSQQSDIPFASRLKSIMVLNSPISLSRKNY